jgi:hypothetical protein
MSLQLTTETNEITHINPLYIPDISLVIYYNDKLHSLLQYGIPFKYAIYYAEYPKETMEYLIILSRMVGVDDAYEILMNIPKKDIKICDIEKKNINMIYVKKVLSYNYSWSVMLLKKKINVKIIKKILNEINDFYFLELLYVNRKIENEFVSYELVKMDFKNTKTQMDIYYSLTAVKIPQDVAHLLCKMKGLNISKIIDIALMGFNNVQYLNKANDFDEYQIDFLRLSKLGYSHFEEFDKVKQTIFDNAIAKNLIIDDEYLYHQYNLIIEPSTKKQKTQ